jgi:protein-S-isoprenylcysteine O-methyltransferase Ste14
LEINGGNTVFEEGRDSILKAISQSLIRKRQSKRLYLYLLTFTIVTPINRTKRSLGMSAIYLLVIGLGVFVISSFALGILLRIINSKKAAEIITRIMHLILVFSVAFPLFYAISNPFSDNLNFDELLNIPSLPLPTISKAVAVVMMFIGIGLVILAVGSLLFRGQGFPLMMLTKKLADHLLYKRTRNPMMLGLFLTFVGIGLLIGSSFFTLWSLIGFIPAIIFWLKFVEERELEMRFGQSYREYKRRVPFLIPSFHKMTGTKL